MRLASRRPSRPGLALAQALARVSLWGCEMDANPMLDWGVQGLQHMGDKCWSGGVVGRLVLH